MSTTKKAAMQRDRLGDAAVGSGGVAGGRVEGIAEDGVSMVSQLRAELVLATGLQL
jgi:hypothetical protein